MNCSWDNTVEDFKCKTNINCSWDKTIEEVRCNTNMNCWQKKQYNNYDVTLK